MPFTLSALDVHYLVKELRPLIHESFVDKVYQGKEDKEDFLFRMRSPKTGKQQLYLQVPESVFLTEHRFSWPQNPRGFCMQLRKHLSNAKLVSVEQKDFERIIEMVFMKGEVSWKVVIELFSKGNVILVNDEGIIRGVLDLQRWKDRTLKVNDVYEYPPLQEDTPNISLERLHEMLSENDRELVKFCATSLGLGGKYAEELVARTGLDKNAKKISDSDAEKLHVSLHSLFNEEIRPVVHKNDAAPFPLHAWKEAESQESFSAAIESLVVAGKIDVIESASTAVSDNHANKYERIIEEQSRKLEGYNKSAEENQQKGEFIYSHYQEFKALLENVVSLHEKGGWDSVKKFIEEKKLPVTVDEKNGKLVVNL